MIKITIECNSVEEAQAHLAKLGNVPAALAGPKPTATAPKPSTPPSRPTPTTAAPSPRPSAATSTRPAAVPARPAAAKPSPTPAVATQSSAGAGSIDYERDVKPLAYQLAQTNRPRLLEIYKGFGVTVGHELKPEQLPEALAMLQAEVSV